MLSQHCIRIASEIQEDVVAYGDYAGEPIVKGWDSYFLNLKTG